MFKSDTLVALAEQGNFLRQLHAPTPQTIIRQLGVHSPFHYLEQAQQISEEEKVKARKRHDLAMKNLDLSPLLARQFHGQTGPKVRRCTDLSQYDGMRFKKQFVPKSCKFLFEIQFFLRNKPPKFWICIRFNRKHQSLARSDSPFSNPSYFEDRKKLLPHVKDLKKMKPDNAIRCCIFTIFGSQENCQAMLKKVIKQNSQENLKTAPKLPGRVTAASKGWRKIKLHQNFYDFFYQNQFMIFLQSDIKMTKIASKNSLFA